MSRLSGPNLGLDPGPNLVFPVILPRILSTLAINCSLLLSLLAILWNHQATNGLQ